MRMRRTRLLAWSIGVLGMALVFTVAAAPAAGGSPGPNQPLESGLQVLSPPNFKAADHRIARQIRHRLEGDRWVLSYQIHCKVHRRVVTLSGAVGNLLAKDRAAQIAWTIPGVRGVRNYILLAAPPRFNWAIRDEVKAFFYRQPALKRTSMRIRVRKGRVILSGVVGSEYRKELAEMVAKEVPGVWGVENKLRINLLATRSGQEIRADVQSRLKWDPRLENPKVFVQVTDHGEVKLSGVVETASAKEHAAQDACVRGTRSVDTSQLKVEPVAPLRGALAY